MDQKAPIGNALFSIYIYMNQCTRQPVAGPISPRLSQQHSTLSPSFSASQFFKTLMQINGCTVTFTPQLKNEKVIITGSDL
jgi:hypothetical protein